MKTENSNFAGSRREVFVVAVGVGAAALVSTGFLPMAAAADDNASRPFTSMFPKRSSSSPAGVSLRLSGQTGNGYRSIARRPARDDAGPRSLFGDRLRFARVRGDTERLAAIHQRSMGWTFILIHVRLKT